MPTKTTTPQGSDIGSLTAQVYRLLSAVESDDRLRVVRAAMALFGQSAPAGGHDDGGATQEGNGAVPSSSPSAKGYFDKKQPDAKGEILAVAACYLEQFERKAPCMKEDLNRVIKAARRNFDSRNFPSDIANARTAGLFNKGAKADGYSLSYYGQQVVDAMPDRDAVKALRRPRTRGTGKSKTSKAGAKE